MTRHIVHSRYDQIWAPNNGIVDGDIGVEIECEGKGLPHRLNTAAEGLYWTVHEDRSLRPQGDNGVPAEYVFRQPLYHNRATEALQILEKFLTTHKGTTVSFSPRTSVHVHINVNKMTLKQIITNLCLYTLFDDVLVSLNGPHRKGNLFCLRVKDAEQMILELAKELRQNRQPRFTNDHHKYCSVNMAALSHYGSLEYRSLEGTLSAERITAWIDVLLAIREASKLFADPIEVVNAISVMGRDALLAKVFPKGIHPKYYPNSAFTTESLYEGARLAQDIAFALPDWAEPKINKDNPKKNNTQEYLDGLANAAAARIVMDAPVEAPRFRNRPRAPRRDAGENGQLNPGAGAAAAVQREPAAARAGDGAGQEVPPAAPGHGGAWDQGLNRLHFAEPDEVVLVPAQGVQWVGGQGQVWERPRGWNQPPVRHLLDDEILQ